MTDKKIRLGYARLPGGSNYGLSKYKPVPDWGEFGGSDYPTNQKMFRISDPGVTQYITLIDTGEQYQMENRSPWATWTARNEDYLWNYNPSVANRPAIYGYTNDRAMIIGFPSPNLYNSATWSWQRGVIGIQGQHHNKPDSTLYGNYIEEAVLLYRKWSDSSRFYGIRMIKDGNKQLYCLQGTDGTGPFKVDSPPQGGTTGGFYMAMSHQHAAYNKIGEDLYVFMGIYLKWGLYDTRQSVDMEIELWGFRLLFDSGGHTDFGKRICHPCLWTFQDAGTSNRIKLTG